MKTKKLLMNPLYHTYLPNLLSPLISITSKTGLSSQLIVCKPSPSPGFLLTTTQMILLPDVQLCKLNLESSLSAFH